MVQVPDAPLSTQVTAKMSGKAEEGGPSVWVSSTFVGDLNGVPFSFLWPGGALVMGPFG